MRDAGRRVRIGRMEGIMPDLDPAAIRAAAAREIEAAADFAARLIRTPSMPGEESAVADLLRRELESLGYDEVRIDHAGNVIGLLRGTGGGRSVMFCTHLDHVSPGDPAHWHADPYSGHVVDGALWGRGAADIKGPTACQAYLAPVLRAAGLRPAGDVYVVATVMEELGGLGAQELVRHLRTDSAVIGEPSTCLLKRGHRGRTGLEVSIKGKAGHASAPQHAVNPHFAAAGFLLAMRDLSMAAHPDFGPSTLTPTLYRSDNESINVIPESVRLHLDWRTVPGEDADEMVRRLQALLEGALIPGSSGHIAVATEERTTYRGLRLDLPAIIPAYALPAGHQAVLQAEGALSVALGRRMKAGLWPFATDGGHLERAGIPPIGFGPGEERHAHIADEHISIAQMEEALAGNAALALALAGPG